jgi:hypothetical protein
MAKSKSTGSIQDRAREILRDPVQGFWVKWAIVTAAGFVFLALIDGIILRLFSWPVDLLMAGTSTYLYLAYRADRPAEPKPKKTAAKKKRPASSKSKAKSKAANKTAKKTASKAAAKKKAPVRRAKPKQAKKKAKPAPPEEPRRKAPVQRKKAVPKKKATRRADHRPR